VRDQEGVILLREAGGYGDVICLGAAALAIKLAHPHWRVIVYTPQPFVDTASHLVGVDEVWSLGFLEDVRRTRRGRCDPLDPTKYPYLKSILDRGYPVVDEYCPAFQYEATCVGELLFNRPQVFARTGGVEDVSRACPQWRVSEDEMRCAREWVTQRCDLGRPLIGYQPRCTCRARSLPVDLWVPLAERLSKSGNVVWFDCVVPPIEVPDGTTLCVGLPIPLVAGVVKQCKVVLTVDSLMVHLCASLGAPAVGVFGPTDGRNITRTYPSLTPLDGESTRCSLPCNYNSLKGWKKECRETGCDRMLSHSVESIANHVEKTSRVAT
jgi:ADP-heptose:LPS heptosyltransferase